MSIPAATLALVLALSVTHNGKEVKLFTRGQTKTQNGSFDYIQLSDAFKTDDKTPRVTTLESVQVCIAWGKACELLRPYVEPNAMQFFFRNAKGEYVPNMRINLSVPARVGQSDAAVLSALTTMQSESRIATQRVEFRAQLTMAMDEFKQGLIDKDGYLAAKTLIEGQITALSAAPATVTPSQTVSEENPFPEA